MQDFRHLEVIPACCHDIKWPKRQKNDAADRSSRTPDRPIGRQLELACLPPWNPAPEGWDSVTERADGTATENRPLSAHRVRAAVLGVTQPSPSRRQR